MTDCPCGTGSAYAVCCGRWHAGALPPTAAALMRSRYTAFVLRLETYLLETWHASTRPARVRFDAGSKWLGLDVKSAQEDARRAEVEFVARYKVGGATAVRLHERSRFLHEDGRWFYVDGEDLGR